MYVSLLVLSVLIYAAALFVYWRHPSASAFHPATLYLLFHGVVFVVRPIFAWHYGYDNMYRHIGFQPSAWDKAQALICTNLGLVAFMAVVLWVTREPVRFRPEAPDPAERAPLLRRFWPVAVPLGLLAAWSLAWYWMSYASGTIAPGAAASGQLGASGYFISAAMMLAPLTAMIAYLGGFRWWSLLPFAAFAVARLGSGSRGDFITAAVMIGLLFLLHRKRKWPSLWLIAAGLLLVPVFDAVQTDRGASIRQFFNPGVEDKGYRWRGEEKPLETMDLAHMEFVEFLIWAVPERTGSYDWFANNLQLVTDPVPRALWPGKPIGSPVKPFDLYRDTGTTDIHITYSVPGMGWFNAGYAGVVMWCALFALIYGAAYRWFAHSRQSHLHVIAYSVFLTTSVLAFRDGALTSLVKQLMFYGAPVLALAMWVRYGPKPAPPAARSEA